MSSHTKELGTPTKNNAQELLVQTGAMHSYYNSHHHDSFGSELCGKVEKLIECMEFL